MLAGCSPEGRLYAVNMAFTNQSTASTDAASVTVMASWSETVTNFTQQNLQVTGCGGSNISYFGQVDLQCWRFQAILESMLSCARSPHGLRLLPLLLWVTVQAANTCRTCSILWAPVYRAAFGAA